MIVGSTNENNKDNGIAHFLNTRSWQVASQQQEQAEMLKTQGDMLQQLDKAIVNLQAAAR
jgi:hypothetical protein